jgi:predicted GIY-YIG superfamily endonuclease
MEKKRVDTYVYKLVRNGQTVYIGITNDLARREQEHREDKQFDKMQVIKGPCTREEAEKLESLQLRLFSFFHSHLPEYNQTYNGK